MLDFIYGAFYFLFGTSFLVIIICALIASMKDY
jgi:hypothetical protein